MEILEWVQVCKSLAISSEVELSQNVSNFYFISAYILAIVLANTRQLRLSFLCLIACIIISNSVIYELLSGCTLHLAYSIAYFIAVKYVKNIKVMLALFAMASFNGLMAWDAYCYEHTETWLYLSYERITALLHVLVIYSCIDWGRINNLTINAIGSLRNIISNSSSILHIRYLLRYNKEA